MLAKNRIKYLKSLHLKKNREAERLFLAEGDKILREVLAADWAITALYITQEFYQQYQSLLLRKPIQYELVSLSELEQITTLVNNPAGIALMQMPSTKPPVLRRGEFALALDGVQDPGNLGTILRIADWYGVEQVICSRDTVEVFNPKVIAASMGSFLRVACHYTDLGAFAASVPVPVFGAVLGGKSVYETKLSGGGLLVMGNESQGVRAEMLPLLTHRVAIPRFGGAESLNVGVATAIFCDNWRRGS